MILTGFMGSGKTTIARMVSRRLGADMVDLDEEIVARAGKEISEIFEEEGEAGFRKREYEALVSLEGFDGVISTGGGVVTHPDSYRFLKDTGKCVIYLKADFDTLYSRIRNDPARPLAARGEEVVRSLYESRLAKYEAVADIEVDTRGTVEDAVERILQMEKC